MLEEAEAAVRGPVETCPGCRITLAVPAAIAAARAGDLERAAQWEQAAEFLATVVMRLPAWYAALDEVRGHCAQARSDAVAACDHFRTAAAGFGASGQPRLAAEPSRRAWPGPDSAEISESSYIRNLPPASPLRLNAGLTVDSHSGWQRPLRSLPAGPRESAPSQ
jgi:hypothetical protein